MPRLKVGDAVRRSPEAIKVGVAPDRETGFVVGIRPDGLEVCIGTKPAAKRGRWYSARFWTPGHDLGGWSRVSTEMCDLCKRPIAWRNSKNGARRCERCPRPTEGR